MTVTIRRILLAIDASPQSLAALGAAVELAAGTRAELEAIFVEDINLIRMARIPLTREVGGITGVVREIDERRIERQLRARAESTRENVANAANRARVTWTFRVARGSVEQELLDRASKVDLVILGRTGWSRSRRLGSTAEAVLSARPQPTLVIEVDEPLQRTFMVAYDGSARSQRALETAARLAEQAEGYLAVAVVADSAARAAELQAEAGAQLKLEDVRYRWLIAADTERLGRMIRLQERCVLLLPDDSPLLKGRTLREALADLDCPVMLIP